MPHNCCIASQTQRKPYHRRRAATARRQVGRAVVSPKPLIERGSRLALRDTAASAKPLMWGTDGATTQPRALSMEPAV
eukprot:14032492-Alexandrium_andersonii.AAC.1